jgi:hypothetical protein
MMRFPLSRQSVLAALPVIAALSGCGSSSSVGTVPVTGKIVFNGEPVADANVFFIPAQGPRATGTTDAAGLFALTTITPKDGAIEGDHLILVEKSVPTKPDDPYSPRKSVIPAWYNSPMESNLRKKVEKGQRNDFTLELR